MPEKCLYCGEEAVIEESVDGGGDHMICIECGSIATGTGKKITTLDFSEDEIDEETSSCVDELNTAQGGDQDSLLLCNSCGVTLGNENTWKSQLCPDCDELSGEENDESEKRTVGASVDVASTKQMKDYASPEDSTSKCVSCGSDNLSVDSVNGDDRLVCTDCGMVNSDSILTTSAFIPESTIPTKYHQPTLPRFAERERVQKGMTAGLSKIACLCSKFCFSSTLQTEAEGMYRHLFSHPKVLHKTLVSKECTAAVCLFIVCRQHDLPISLYHFKADVGIFRHFLRSKNNVLKILGTELPHMSMTSLLIQTLHPQKFDQSLMGKVKDILFLFRRAWLTQGRVRIGLISLAAYYAYVSSDKCKKFISRNDFCLQKKFPQLPRKLSSECEKFLLKLAGSLPWVTSTQITTKRLPLYINSILQYQDSLLHLVFTPEENVDITDPTQSSCDSTRLATSDNSNNRNCLRRKLSPMNSQKERLLPSASKRQKMNVNPDSEVKFEIPSNINLDSPILQENEFDEEISSYILSSEEQEKMRLDKMSIFQKVN